MNKQSVVLTQEEWDRLVQILYMIGMNDSDAMHILKAISRQVHLTPADEIPEYLK